jgi:hypothetical protein
MVLTYKITPFQKNSLRFFSADRRGWCANSATLQEIEMSQNLLSLTFSDAALNTLETHFTGFASLSPDQRRSILEIGDNTEAFFRQTIVLAAQNAQAIPHNLNMPEA